MDSTSTNKTSQSGENSRISTSDLSVTPTLSKRKCRFNIGLYAKKKKLVMDQLMLDKIETDVKVKKLQNRYNYMQTKAADLENQVQVPQTTSNARGPYRESTVNKENSDLLDLSKAQCHRRKIQTLEVLKDVHCQQKNANDITPVLCGMWSTLIQSSTTQYLESLIKTSQVCKSKIIPHIVRENVNKFEKDQANFIRSVALLYKGGILTKTKYKEMRKEKETFMNDIEVPKYVAYDRLMAFVKSINMGESCDLQDFAAERKKSPVNGVYRPLQSLTLRLAEMYLMLNKEASFLHWFNNEEGTFFVAVGADGAPFGKDETATAYLLSFLNVLQGVQSCDHNYLLLGANCDETHEVMYDYTKHLVEEMEAMEKSEFEVLGKKVKFRFKLIPSDQKWMASMSGELNNAAMYFSSFANVSKRDILTVGGTMGTDKAKSTWIKWSFTKRIEDAKAVSKFKQKNKIPDDTKNVSQRKKVTEYISSLKSRQEFAPPLGKYVECLRPEPLHNGNNAWQCWNLDILTTAMQLTNKGAINSAKGDVKRLPKDCPFAKYVFFLRNEMKAGRLYNKVEKWFREMKKEDDFSYRFTGKETKLFCCHFMEVCRVLISHPGIPRSTLVHVHSLAFSGLCLRNSTSLFSRIHIAERDIDCLKEACNLYFNCQSLLLNKVAPTMWTIGKAIPFHTQEIFNELGFGLGMNSMQGREAKHSKLASYAKNTTRGKRLRWWQILKHEFMELVWLKEQNPMHEAKKLQVDETDHKKKCKDQYIPAKCANDKGFCYCGLPNGESEGPLLIGELSAKCEICSSELMQLVQETCKNGKIHEKLKRFLDGAPGAQSVISE